MKFGMNLNRSRNSTTFSNFRYIYTYLNEVYFMEQKIEQKIIISVSTWFREDLSDVENNNFSLITKSTFKIRVMIVFN